MPNISQVQVGSTTYDIQASQLETARGIDGVSFNGSADISHYAVCTTSAATATKIATITGYALTAGAVSIIKFTHENSAENPFLNISGTGAKPLTVTAWNAGDIMIVVYDGTNYLGTITQGVLDGYLPLDGYSENASVGNADQLISTVMVNDQEPYVFRTSGGSADIGDREFDSIVGVSLPWNQLVDTDTVSVTIPTNRKYIARISGTLSIGTSDGTAITVDGSSGDMVTDLSRLFGITIANNINNLEQENPGDGVAYFLKYFPKYRSGYYPYYDGDMLHVTGLSAHNTIGFNAYDNNTGTAKLLGGYEYQITGTYTSLSYVDINGDAETITPDSDGIFTPINNGTLTVVGGDSTTTCVHLVWSGYRNGEFEAYASRSYPLDSSITLRGRPVLDANGNLYYNGDTYASDGTVTKKYELIKFGDLSWVKNSTYGYFSADVPDDGAIIAYGNRATVICAPYITGLVRNSQSQIPNMGDKVISYYRASGNYKIVINDADFNTSDAFKSYIKDYYLIYLLASSAYTTTTADAYQSPQIVDDFGTEEYVIAAQNGVQIPVGHNTNYPANLRDKAQHLPDLDSAGDGSYAIRQTGTQMALVPLPQTALAIPDPPTTDGIYNLQVGVSDGEYAFTWVAAT